METMIVLGLAAAVLLTLIGGTPSRPAPPQIIYVHAAPQPPDGAGCLPLLILVGVVLATIAFK